MTLSGILVMCLSVSTVVGLFGWCIWRVLTEPPEEVDHVHGVELHTPDMDEDKS